MYVCDYCKLFKLQHTIFSPKDIKDPILKGASQVQVVFILYLRRHVVCDAELQVCEDALHAVEGLLPGGSQVFLHGPGHRGEDGLSRLPRIHHLPRVLGGRGDLVFMETLDVCESLLHRHNQPTGIRKSIVTDIGYELISQQQAEDFLLWLARTFPKPVSFITYGIVVVFFTIPFHRDTSQSWKEYKLCSAEFHHIWNHVTQQTFPMRICMYRVASRPKSYPGDPPQRTKKCPEPAFDSWAINLLVISSVQIVLYI